jgi:hypothetical protein
MRRIIQANIDRFMVMLDTETEARLRAEEEVKLAQEPKNKKAAF